MSYKDFLLPEGQQPPLGAHLVTGRRFYTHHGIYAGDGRVIHYAGLAAGLSAGPVEETDLLTFRAGKRTWVRQHASPKFTAAQVVARARSRLSENGYSVTANNCEHFVLWCIHDIHSSKQVNRGIIGVTPALGIIAKTTARQAVMRGGVIKTLSGAGIMSGLRSASIVGGGAVGGLVNVPAALGAGAAMVMNSTVLHETPGMSSKERRARRFGRVASHSASVAAVAGGVGAVYASGAVVGLSATGIASGLAAIGSAVTFGAGGMAAGATVVMAAPAAAAVGVGYGVYKLAQLLIHRTDDAPR
jgi:hypothetical protein